MHPVVVILLVACGSSLARYRGDEPRNLLVREEPYVDIDEVECPVCEENGHWMQSNEECPIVRAGKRYKRCALGTYVNHVCGDRRDCYRGPGEQCTVKRDYDLFGQKCAPGYYCNKHLGICTGFEYVGNPKVQYYLNPTPYTMEKFGAVGMNTY